MYAYPAVSPGHREAFVFALFAMGKYLKQISRLVGTHQCKKTLLRAVDCAERVWRSAEGTTCLPSPRPKIKKKELFSLSEMKSK